MSLITCVVFKGVWLLSKNRPHFKSSA